MSLQDLIYTTSPKVKSIVSLSAKLCNKIEYFDQEDLFKELYNNFPPYSLELTISPKSSPILNQIDCSACGAHSLRSLDEQNKFMHELLEDIINKFKVNILGTTEKYKDNLHIHTHSIISPMPMNHRTRLRKYIQLRYELFNNILVNLKPIDYSDRFQEYLVKEPYCQYHYYNKNKLYNIDAVQAEMELKEKKELLKIYNCPILFHKHDCSFEICPICDWIEMKER